MKKKDFVWISCLLAIIVFLLYPATHEIFKSATGAHPYLMGFVKVAILATMGELLAIRIATGDYKKPAGIVYRAIVWGILGMGFVIAFTVFNGGVITAQGKGLLPSVSNTTVHKLITAFFTSAFMNLIFGPTFMAFHRFTDTFIDLGKGKLGDIFKVKLSSVVDKIDWNGFIGFVVIKTIPFFWIPAHTVTFMLPEEYRVLMAAFLSIALGAILAFAKRKNTKRA